MKLRYGPVRYNEFSLACIGSSENTTIEPINENTVNVDDTPYEFDVNDVAWPTVSQDTNGIIIEAHRENGELFLTVRRFYSSSIVGDWDTGDYHEVIW
jgi:hypothetical protein